MSGWCIDAARALLPPSIAVPSPIAMQKEMARLISAQERGVLRMQRQLEAEVDQAKGLRSERRRVAKARDKL
jgi:hypothetical protein